MEVGREGGIVGGLAGLSWFVVEVANRVDLDEEGLCHACGTSPDQAQLDDGYLIVGVCPPSDPFAPE